jgi:NADH:ubiquinone oxidoreductase subunit 3 (subunit A)
MPLLMESFDALGHRHTQKKENFMTEYAPILIYIFLSLGLSLLILGLSFVFSTQKADPEKLSAYECGFDPFDDARSRFDIRFYLVAILFIIFDLEVTFLFPWAVSLNKISFFGFWSMIVFLVILTLGFIYEWQKGALEWE